MTKKTRYIPKEERKSCDGAVRVYEGKYFIRPEKRIEDFPNGGYVDYVLKNLIQKPYKI